ncbi:MULTISPECIES: two-component system sensor histidine kinase KdpD [Leclercia]|jgi:two-component system sensor histidine kinase KdpD|uniref:two-component system sensor histidine kinase KdpD n=1 Tax=Leclercia TaxID=83654 RepID=UPI000CDC962F|nr:MULTISPECIES: two-component system sensor histidine kinase KdpD [Leclercia]POW73260.1 two-component system sensor histidine kinase KdbD [Leclercia sp. LSNIH4]AUY38216.1 two-component system sensor histidine kinase KdbD [Leclercia sp. LSNIH3]MDQ2128816.1 two-component system sensor histidine kinase KdpD [Leclercia adecarboxylata]MDV7057429.1 two-component system sensor histidine kinase KdpD [Leclercia adecarboxylata]QEY54420.1 two-component system sensor histidine kinase KdbD [Leclercia adec
MIDEPQRPDPDKLLEQAATPHRGKLKIFFGACAGVGKTFAMLSEAQRLRAQGLDILIGVAETHGRQETAALLAGLATQPSRRIHHRGRLVTEFDLDAALARRPALILMDELAHSNAPGSRHPKRWQDVEELLEAGIDVFTTVNVQHLESLNDVVSGVTGIQVRETVPDPFFDAADEVVLVDLPPDDLRQRLHEGKVYIAGQAERAIEHFFRKGNLIALRELALRRTADRVDDQMRAWRDRQGEEKVWHTRDAILLCIGHGSGNEKLVRTAARLAAKFGSVWHAVYVETPQLHRLPENQRRAILSALRLAQELGAETATLAEQAEDKAILRYAREHNLGKIVIGRRSHRRWFNRDTFADRLAQRAPDLDLLIVALDDKPAALPAKTPDNRAFTEKWRIQLRGCLVAVLLCALITFIANQWLPDFDAANLVMIYLLGVVIVALFYGRWPSVLATVINVVSFDLFFIAPRGTLAVSDVQYVLTFAVMLAVGLLIGNLTAGVRYQARIARYREQRTRHLYEMSKALAVGRTPQDIAHTSQQFIHSTFHARSLILSPDREGALRPMTPVSGMTPWDEAIARWSFDKGQPAGAGTDTLPGVPYLILPLQHQGVAIVEPSNLRQLMIPEQQRLLETFTLLVANALERLALTASEEQARLASERESIRNSLLAALSHDLRTPLTVLFGQSEILTLDLAAEGSRHAPQASEIRQHVLNTTRLVNNLLDMARIQSGGFNLKKEWLTLEEVIGSALKTLEPGLGGRHIALDMPDPLALIHVDGPLFERVLINLLENAGKYAGRKAQIGIHASVTPEQLQLEVWDTGPGIPAGQEQAIFDKFARGNKESAIPGVGLGLAICQAIVEVHGGTITAHNRPEGGARFCVTLPRDTPPELNELPEDL